MRDGHGLNISNRNHFVNIDKVFFIPTFLHRDFETKFRKLPLPELHFRNFRCRSLFLFCGTTGTHTQSLCQATVGIIREKKLFSYLMVELGRRRGRAGQRDGRRHRKRLGRRRHSGRRRR